MAIQSKAQGGSRIAACTVENPAKLWKALAARWSKRGANLYGARLSRQEAGQRAGRWKISDRWKTSLFWSRNRSNKGVISAARQFETTPILGLSRNVPRGTFPAMGWFPKLFHVEHLNVAD
jgi:hypothetical protein